MPDAGNAISNRNTGQAVARFEGRFADSGNAVRDRDTRQADAAFEGVLSNSSDRFSFDGVWND